MPGKKAHKPRNMEPPRGRKSTGQTNGQFERDPKGRKGQYGGAGDSPLIKK
ncbi:MAG: hypothetical protein M1436_00625 [Acidobacteria bacterium]|nr:hypothetical protein [Acidobacteriota bacterium]